MKIDPKKSRFSRQGTGRIVSCLCVVFLLSGCGQDFDVWRADRLMDMSTAVRQKAIALYQRISAKTQDQQKRELVRFKLAKSYLESGQYPEAIQEVKDMNRPAARSLMAQALYLNGDYTQALDIFNKIGELESDKHRFFYAQTLEKNNLYDKALDIYSRIRPGTNWWQKAQDRISAINLLTTVKPFDGVSAPVRKIIEDSPSQEAYPQAAALILLAEEDIELTSERKLITEGHYVLKILNDRGKEQYGEISLSYDSTYETLELVYARTILPDGRVVTVGDKNIRDVSMYLNFPLYSNARVRIVSMPEIAVGAVIEYKIRVVDNQLPNKRDFNMTYWLQGDQPILLQTCRIRVPLDCPLRHKIVNASYNTFGYDMNPVVTQEKGQTVYSLEFRDVPQIIPEPLMPPGARINPYIIFSTFESWESIRQWWKELYENKTVADESITAKTRELIQGKTTDAEKIRAVYNFVVEDIRYVAVEYGDAGYEPHAAADIFKNKYGDCKDKAILLIAMLKASGIDAYPVLISTEESLDPQEDLPTILFNHAIACVRLGQELVFMDGTATTVPFGDLPLSDQDRLVLIFEPGERLLVTTPVFAASHNLRSTRMKIRIGADESMEGEREAKTSGVYEHGQRYWLKYTMPILIEEGLKQRVRAIADNALLVDYEIQNADDLDKPILLRYRFEAPQFLVKAGQTRIMNQFGSLDTSYLFKESRRYPLDFGTVDVMEDSIDIELPDHLAVKYLPPPVVVRTRWFDIRLQYTMQDKKTIHVDMRKTTMAKTVPVEEYAEYKSQVEGLSEAINQHVVLEEKR